ncbi:SGNH/GDSL hydrolase family protein [Hymenobacter caeli]|uniref:Lysophospholipase L1-like esterase n=1 Tax=Hymenobacter caeli TaxID=2735894 RepID=A0ABX2FQJ7_9BACT|nr:SGNH/GDSL hydrolase family protein [Hymenobacter caeli]NRT19441.1 lysophospholipase L1-like esterase [Hymenobacter caeli]
MRFITILALVLANTLVSAGPAAAKPPKTAFFFADDKRLQYTGRIDFSDAKKPRFWAPGVYVTARFRGPSCAVVVHDELRYGTDHNYVVLAVDGVATRQRLAGRTDTLRVAGLAAGPHTLVLCKATETGQGYLELVGLRCARLLPPPPRPTRRLECIGNSITCGTGSDLSVAPCGQGKWYDQHNAYQAYGPRTARALGAEWQLTAVSGIGLMHSCCDMKTVMPEVFDRLNPGDKASPAWDFRRYQPDVVTICLGQNDGVQDSVAFCGRYLAFLKTVRAAYPAAHLVCLSSPMADAVLTAVLHRYLTGVVAAANAGGDAGVHKYFFSRRFSSGCGTHPDLAEHQLIAQELTAFLKQTMHW